MAQLFNSVRVVNISKYVSCTPKIRLLIPYQIKEGYVIFEEIIFKGLQNVLKDLQISFSLTWLDNRQGEIKVALESKYWRFFEEEDLLVLCEKKVSYIAQDITDRV